MLCVWGLVSVQCWNPDTRVLSFVMSAWWGFITVSCARVVFCLSTGPLTSFHWPCATVMFIVLSSLVHFVEHMACGFLRVTIAN